MMGKDKGVRGPHIIVKPGHSQPLIVPVWERLHGFPVLNALWCAHYRLNGSSEKVAAAQTAVSHLSGSPGGSVTPTLMTMPSHSAHSALQRPSISMDTDMDNNLNVSTARIFRPFN